MKLLSRQQFREGVFARDNHKCVVCKAPAVDAHHIIERKLWSDEGYYLDNGASLCEIHHRLAERNIISPQNIRLYTGITNKIIPEQFDINLDYTKWGDILKQPTRVDIKYPTTRYFSFSPGKDNLRIKEDIDLSLLVDVPLIVTVKMDGSNAKVTNKYVAARNGSQANHSSFDMLKAIHPSLKNMIPDNLILFGEWLYAKHSIHYKNDITLNSLYQVFGIYDKENKIWFSWRRVEAFCKKNGFHLVPIIAEIQEDVEWKLVNKICELAENVIAKGHEGIVVRSAYPFHYGQFEQLVGKYVRANHVQTDKHWMHQKMIRNEVSK